MKSTALSGELATQFELVDWTGGIKQNFGNLELLICQH